MDNLLKHIVSAVAAIAKNNPIKSFSLLLCIILLTLTELWEPFSLFPSRNWNITQLNDIKVADADNFSFAVFGDNQKSKFVLENLLKMIDHDPDIAFAICLGDMVSRGKNEKYHYFLEQVKDNLGVPLLTAVGSHERNGRGIGLYHEIFGPSNYSFRVGRNYFIMLDDTDKEELDLVQKNGWLEDELKTSGQDGNRFIFMHIPLYDPRVGKSSAGLPEESPENLINLFLRYNVTRIFSSHVHGYFEGRWSGIPYTITGGAGAELDGTDPDHFFFHFLKINVNKDSVDVEVKHVPCPEHAWLDRFVFNTEKILSFFYIHSVEMVLLLISAGLAAVILRNELGKKESGRD